MRYLAAALTAMVIAMGLATSAAADNKPCINAARCTTPRGLFTGQLVEVQRDDSRDGLGEGLERAPVIGVHDSPGLEVRDDSLDDVANLVDLLVEFPLPVQQVPVSGFLDRGEHVVADVPFVAHPVPRIQGQENAGLIQAVCVVAASIDR